MGLALFIIIILLIAIGVMVKWVIENQHSIARAETKLLRNQTEIIKILQEINQLKQ